jgi:predicted permease
VGTLLQDLRFSVRVLRKSPGFTFAAIATLALAIGANAVVFSVMNALVIKPLDVPQPETLFGLWRSPDNDMAESYADYIDLRDRNRSLDSLAAYNLSVAGLDTGGEPSRSFIQESTGNYFDTLRLQPFLGRFFHASDERGPGSAPYLVLTHAFWHTHFHDDPGVVGRVVMVNKHPYTIIGVAPPGFHGTLLFFNPDSFAPIVQHKDFLGVFGGPESSSSANQPDPFTDRSNRWMFMTLGHLKPGVTPAQASADLNAISADLAKTYPKDDRKVTFTLAKPNLYGEYLGEPVRAFMTALMLLSALILLAACANLGSLFASRAADRSRELALRLALGATRTRMLRQLFTEAVMISLVGGTIGLLGSMPLLRWLSAWQPIPRWPIQLAVTPDAHVYELALFLTLASGFLFGAVPVRQVLRTAPYEVVKAGATSARGRRITMREVLLGVQVAICAVLVTASLVAVRGLGRSLHNDFGFDPENNMLAETDLTMAGYKGAQIPAMQKRILDTLAAIPGVDSVAFASTLPMGEDSQDSIVFRDDTADLRAANAADDPFMYKVSPEYFRAAGTTLLSGREFTWHDDAKSPRVAIVNPEFARRIFGSSEKAMGRYFKMPDGSRLQVVGIAEPGKHRSINETPKAAMFLPILQWPETEMLMVVRYRGDSQQIAAAMRDAFRGIDAALPVFIQPRMQQMASMLFGPRMATISLGVLGIMGAMLAITGIFGMAAYSVSKRLRELGIRVALGAQRKEVLQAALGRAFKLLAWGSVAGLILGILASRVLAFIVYQATPRDPLVLAGAVLAMMLTGLLATWIPARRAMNIDPVRLLRDE